jgi:hypothetical protein
MKRRMVDRLLERASRACLCHEELGQAVMVVANLPAEVSKVSASRWP